jgi:hypothetical protein
VEIQRVGFVCPVGDLAGALATWVAILGVEPSFADGERWAQFDVAGARIALAGTDRFSETPGLMMKVADCEAAVRELREAGLDVDDVVAGPHESRAQLRTPGGWSVMLYSSS